MKKVILVTGASSGLGLAIANALHDAGHVVYGSSRNITKQMKSHNFKSMEMDVTSDKSVQNALTHMLDEEGRLDVVINNAGNGIASPLYSVPVDVAKKQFDVNFFGVIRVNSFVLPRMIDQGEGLIINMSSLAGLFGLPYQGLYAASKFAIEGYSQSLRMELMSTGIKVAVLNPGDYQTSFTVNRQKSTEASLHPKLQNDFQAAVTAMERDEAAGRRPIDLARKVVKIVEEKSPSHNYLIGAAGQTMVPALKRILPESLFVKMMNSHYGIK